MIFGLKVRGMLSVLVVTRFVGWVCCKVGGIFLGIPFVLARPSKIGWVLKIGCVGGIVWFCPRVFYVMGVSSLVIIYFFSCPFGLDIWFRILQVMASLHRIRG